MTLCRFSEDISMFIDCEYELDQLEQFNKSC